MKRESQGDYYSRRAVKARDMATRAIDPTIALIHAEMADRYAELSGQAAPRDLVTLAL